jgi:hypothetical protein
MKQFLRSNAQARRLYYRLKMLRGLQGQSDESRILLDLATAQRAPKTFVEFGFHPVEFNCAALAQHRDWRGLLIDGNERQVADARAVLPNRIDVQHRFLTLDNLDFIADKFPKIGVLSIDVDGNDYWFLELLIGLTPTIISVEYNSSFGQEPITVPYDPAFDRHEKHPSGWYHGASLTALADLCAKNGYGLAAVAEGGANAFFTKDGALDPISAWKPNLMRYSLSGKSHDMQWQTIKHLPFTSSSKA